MPDEYQPGQKWPYLKVPSYQVPRFYRWSSAGMFVYPVEETRVETNAT